MTKPRIYYDKRFSVWTVNTTGYVLLHDLNVKAAMFAHKLNQKLKEKQNEQ